MNNVCHLLKHRHDQVYNVKVDKVKCFWLILPIIGINNKKG